MCLWYRCQVQKADGHSFSRTSDHGKVAGHEEKPFSEIPRLESGRLILRQIMPTDADSPAGLAHSANVYRHLPTFLYEQKYADIHRVIDGLYAECLKESLILGVFPWDEERFWFESATGMTPVQWRASHSSSEENTRQEE